MADLNKSDRRFGQYITENHGFEGSADDFFEETAYSIGSIVHCFNCLDGQLNAQICTMINDRTDVPGAIVIYKQSFSSKIDLFYRLVRSREIDFEEEIPCFKELVERLKKSGTLRNAVIHAEWDSLDDNGYTYVKINFTRDGMTQQYWQFTSDSLDDIDEYIHQTYMMFDTFNDEMQELMSK